MKFVAYYRVSTQRQDYGIEAQRQAVTRYLGSVGGELLAAYEEKESGSINTRPQLALAIQAAKANRATLIIAKLDRLSRNASFLMSLQDSNLDFVCCDMPNADRFTIGILALVAQRERELISQRTRAGLAVAKARGAALGNPRLSEARKNAVKVVQEQRRVFSAQAMRVITELQSTGCTSLTKLSKYLNIRGVPTARGGAWTATAVKRVLQSQSAICP